MILKRRGVILLIAGAMLIGTTPYVSANEFVAFDGAGNPLPGFDNSGNPVSLPPPIPRPDFIPQIGVTPEGYPIYGPPIPGAGPLPGIPGMPGMPLPGMPDFIPQIGVTPEGYPIYGPPIPGGPIGMPPGYSPPTYRMPDGRRWRGDVCAGGAYWVFGLGY